MASKLLLVEDDDDLRELFTLGLEMEGYEVETVSNGQEAIETLRDGAGVHLVVADLFMPVLDGIGLLRWMRDHQIQIPVLVLSASVDKVLLSEAAELGAADFLEKPVVLQDLVEKVVGMVPVGG